MMYASFRRVLGAIAALLLMSPHLAAAADIGYFDDHPGRVHAVMKIQDDALIGPYDSDRTLPPPETDLDDLARFDLPKGPLAIETLPQTRLPLTKGLQQAALARRMAPGLRLIFCKPRRTYRQSLQLCLVRMSPPPVYFP